MKSFLLFLLLFPLTVTVPQPLVARPTQNWTDQEIFEKADLVVIANVISSRVTDERSTLPDIEPPVKVIGVETEFETCVVLKGPKEVSKLRLHHYKTDEEFTNGPILIEIPLGRRHTYLLFLVKESDGRYAPATGQTDPATSSVLQLRGATGPRIDSPEPAVVPRQDEGRH